jgi:ParB-like chromosome segregation protein Spo0J
VGRHVLDAGERFLLAVEPAGLDAVEGLPIDADEARQLTGVENMPLAVVDAEEGRTVAVRL